MDPIDPWIDSAAVRKLAQSLLMPVRREETPEGEVCFGDGFVGFAGPGPAESSPAKAESPANSTDSSAQHHMQQQARQSLSVARVRAESGGLLERPMTRVPVAVASLPTAPAAEVETQRGETEPQAGPVETPSIPAQPAESTVQAPESVRPASEPVPQAPATVEQGPAAAAPVPAPEEQAPEPVKPGPTDTGVSGTPETRAIPAPEPPTVTQAPFVERLHAYGQWLTTAISAKAFFVTDHDGHVLMDQVRAPKLLQVARTLAQASHAANRHAGGSAVGSLHVKLGEASILEVLSVETGYGPLILGIVVPSVISSPAIPVISTGLQQVVDGYSH